MKKLVISIIVAFLLWTIMFSPWTKEYVHFWTTMSVSAVLLIFLSFIFYGKEIRKSIWWSWKDVGIGVLSAAVLWGIFWLGNYFSTLLFPFAESQIGGIYNMKSGENYWVVGLLLLFVIGPAEEIFWRGYVQQRLNQKYSVILSTVVATVVYTLVHIASFNFMLIMAAMVCGAFWGLMYSWKKNLLPLIISHALWDVAVFILFPIA